MKTIFRIAKLELSTLFYSPIAWFLGIIFMFQSAFAYTKLLNSYLKLQDLGGAYLDFLHFLTGKIIGGSFGTYSVMISKIYLYLPLLTMGLISREISSGTIKLLYSSPIKVKQIVLGKFFAIMAYNLLLIAILGVLMIAAQFNIDHADWGIIGSCMLGVFLLLCAYAAIGLFMSSLTGYQIVAAISTLVVFAVLDNVGQLWQGVDFVRNLTYFLSMAGRTGHILSGLIVTKDVIYFVIITILFIVFTIIKLQSDRSNYSFLAVAGKYLGALLVVLIIGYVSGLPRFTGYIDATATNRNTLSPNTQKVIKEIGKEPLEIVFYINLLDKFFRFGSPEERNLSEDRWSPYLRFKYNIKLSYVYYWAPPLDPNANLEKNYPGKTHKQIARRFAQTYKISFSKFKNKAEIDRIINLAPEQYRCVMQVKFRGKTTFLRLFDDQTVFPTEPEITAALKRLTVPLPKIAFLEGEYERSIDKLGLRDYGAIANDISFRYALINQGFDVQKVNLATQDIPADITALVIGDPRTAFSAPALTKIQQYITRGGHLLITAEGDKKEVLKPILAPLGIQITDGLLLETSKNDPLDRVVPLLTKHAVALSKGLQKPFEDSMGVTMPGVAGLTYATNAGFDVKPLLVTDEKKTWNKKGKAVLDSADIEYSPEEGDDHRAAATVLALTRTINGREQRIIVAGDADFLTTSAMADRKANFVFNTQLFRWFTYGQFPIDATQAPSKDFKLNLSSGGLDNLKILLLGVWPGLVLLFAVVFLIRRKRK